jgi:hypothetical protein
MSGPNTTATGGFLLPDPQPPVLNTVPDGLTFVQFLQSVLVGLSGFRGSLVRPEWQQQPPINPDIDVNWLAFGIESAQPDNNAYVGYDANNNPFMQRNELITLTVSVYGPQAYDNIGLIRDGFQLTQNLTSLRAANVGFAYDTQAQHVPDFFNERWIDRWRAQFFIRRQVMRTYPILNFISVSGTVYAVAANSDPLEVPFAAGS